MPPMQAPRLSNAAIAGIALSTNGPYATGLRSSNIACVTARKQGEVIRHTGVPGRLRHHLLVQVNTGDTRVVRSQRECVHFLVTQHVKL